MTKAQEMQRFDEFLRKLPKDTYLHTWLAEIRDEVESDIRCDIFPSHTPRETHQRCQQLHKDTSSFIRKQLERKRSDAARIISDAKAEAKRIKDNAEADAEEIRRTFRSEVRTLRQALQAVA